MTRALWLLGGLTAAIYLAMMWPGLGELDGARFWIELATKPVPLLCMIIWVARTGRGPYHRWLLAGLVFAMIGDTILVFRGGDTSFVLGLAANLITHVLYAIGFTRDHRRWHPFRLAVYLAWVGGLFIVLLPGLGGMRWPVAAYCLAIGLMMWRAAARVGHTGAPTRPELAAAIGAALFGLCDTFIAIDRFAAPSPWFSYPVMTCYWLGQLGIAWSAGRERSDAAHPPD